MKSEIAILTILVTLAGNAIANGCSNTPVYKTDLKLSCQGEELKYRWPNYKNVSQFYVCQGLGRPLMLDCEAGEYFCFVMQICQKCDEYFPSPICENLPKTKSSSCQNIDGGSPEPTPIYPTTKPTTKPTPTPTESTNPTPTTAKTTKPTPTPTAPTEDFPPAPSPTTVDPNIPTPPTAAPTPPPVEAKPPTIVVPGF